MRPSLTCPRCGGEMNHQADKLVHPRTVEEADRISLAFDGIIERVFACPACGWIDSVRSSSPDDE